jgi:acetyl esterase/lipase
MNILLAVCLLFAPQASGSRVELDIAYIENGSEKQKLDLFLPDGKDFPTIVFVHGGAWVNGDRKMPPYAAIGRVFQQSGIACAVISYRLSPGVQHPAHAEDGAAAFAWTKKNIGERGGDESRVFLAGHSAGGHIVALIASDGTYLAKHKLNLSDVAGCVPMGAVLDVRGLGSLSSGGTIFKEGPESLESASPIAHLRKEMPRMLLMVAERDMPILITQAKRYADKAKEIEAPVTFFEMPDRDHITTIAKLMTGDDVAVKKVVEFVSK